MAQQMHTPYRGLQPFTEEDARYFYGRETDTQLISAHLLTTRLTVLFGASGVGKSSLLMAGVAPYLEELGGVLLIIIRDWHHETFFERIKATICEQVWGSGHANEGIGFAALLEKASADTGKTIAFVFDQFEDYFEYHKLATPFEAELAIAVNTFDLDVNFLFSLREDSLAALDRLHGRLPDLWKNSYRLEHLNREMAIEAMKNPLIAYREDEKTEGPVGIESEVVESLLRDCIPRGGALNIQTQGYPVDEVVQSETGSDTPVEAAVLQLVLEQLWREEASHNENRMRMVTLQKMGGVNHIMESHLNNMLKTLGVANRELCAMLLDRLVTPSGRKIAYSQSDLCEMLKLGEAELQPVLQGLSQGDARILRTLPPAPGEPDNPRYELYHDKLAEAARSWLSRYQGEQQKRISNRKQARRQAFIVSFVVLFFVCAGAGKYFYDDWYDEQPFSYINNLSNDKQYGLIHSVTFLSRYVGKTLPEYYLKISPTRVVSRMHLMITKDLEAQDMRTSFGTMVNAEFLEYGTIHQLRDGDILSLAGNETFRFTMPAGTRYFPQAPVRKDAVPNTNQWAIFIDGEQRHISPLNETAHYVSYEEGLGYRISEDDPGNALALIESDFDGEARSSSNEVVHKKVYITDLDDAHQLYATYKQDQNNAYKYPRVSVDSDVKITLGTTLEVQAVVFDYRRKKFQIVTISRDDFPG